MSGWLWNVLAHGHKTPVVEAIAQTILAVLFFVFVFRFLTLCWLVIVPCACVCAQVKRIGGGFGGKETRTATSTAIIALAARKLQHPVAMMLDRAEDMKFSGGRHPFYGRYKAAASRSTSKLLALQIDL